MKYSDEIFLRMLTKKSFIDLFWEKLREARKKDPAITRKEIFDRLNDYYYSITGRPRYIDYESFSRTMRRKA